MTPKVFSPIGEASSRLCQDKYSTELVGISYKTLRVYTMHNLVLSQLNQTHPRSDKFPTGHSLPKGTFALVRGATCVALVLGATLTACGGEKPRVGTTVSTTTTPYQNTSTTALASEAEASTLGFDLIQRGIGVIRGVAQLRDDTGTYVGTTGQKPDPADVRISQVFIGDAATTISSLATDLSLKSQRLDGELTTVAEAGKVSSTTTNDALLTEFVYESCVRDQTFPIDVNTGTQLPGNVIDVPYVLTASQSGGVWYISSIKINPENMQCLLSQTPPTPKNSQDGESTTSDN